MNEAITVEGGHAVVRATTVSGELLPKASATDIITLVRTKDGDQAAIKVVGIGGGGGGGEVSGDYLPLSGGDLLGQVFFDIGGTSGKNTALIGVKTASGTVALIGAKTDDNGVLRDVAVIPKLQSESFQAQQIYSSFIGTSDNPVTRIHAKKIGAGLMANLLTIPDESGTIARIEDIDAAVGNISTALTAILGE